MKNGHLSSYMLLPGLDGGTVRGIDVGSRDAGDGDASIGTGPVTGTDIFKRYAFRPTLALTISIKY